MPEARELRSVIEAADQAASAGDYVAAELALREAAALQEAQGAMGGDISGVTMGLGVTFNATLTALVSCIIVMFWMHQLQQFQDRLVLDCRTYVDRQLLRKLRVVSK